MPVFALYITFIDSGRVTVHMFDTAFARALEMVALASQPVTLRTADYL